MHAPKLCRERLNRLLRVLSRHGGNLRIRELARSYSIWRWEVEQAAALGWVEIVTMKPATGRPSPIAKRVSQTPAAKLPPWRCELGKPISTRHQLFALYSVYCAVRGGIRHFITIPPLTTAYQMAFPKARKRPAAAASMSRLLRLPHVRLARAWCYARMDGDIPKGEAMPATMLGIAKRLMETGSSRINLVSHFGAGDITVAAGGHYVRNFAVC